MPTITIPDDTYQRLRQRADSLQISVERLIAPALEQIALEPQANGHQSAPLVDLPYDEWKKVFEQLLANAKSRAHLYPPGFEADVSREAMYEGCGE